MKKTILLLPDWILLASIAVSCRNKPVEQAPGTVSPFFTSEIESFGSYSYPDWSVVTFKVEFKR